MTIGTTCPRYLDLGLLFPKALGLQKAMCLYFVIVVGLCKHAVTFFKKIFLSQLSHSIAKPFDSKFATYRHQLQLLASSVREEVLVASKQVQVFESQAQALERREAANSHRLGNCFREQVNNELGEAISWKRKLFVIRLLNACSKFDHIQAWKIDRKLGTSSWIFESAAYVTWKTLAQTSMLWFVGRLGSGKTVLSASVVDDLAQIESSLTAYFFARFDNAESLGLFPNPCCLRPSV